MFTGMPGWSPEVGVSWLKTLPFAGVAVASLEDGTSNPPHHGSQQPGNIQEQIERSAARIQCFLDAKCSPESHDKEHSSLAGCQNFWPSPPAWRPGSRDQLRFQPLKAPMNDELTSQRTPFGKDQHSLVAEGYSSLRRQSDTGRPPAWAKSHL